MRIGSDAERSLASSLVHQIRIAHNVSRVELARRLKLAPSTVGQYVDRLMEDGFILEGRKAVQSAGRPPIVLKLNPDAGRFIGIDFEGRQLMAVAVDFALQPQMRHKIPIHASDSAERVISKIQEAIEFLQTKDSRLLGIGVGVPGAVDTQNGIGLHYQYIRGWSDIPLGERLSSRFRVPVDLDNNIRVMALAEQLFGEGRGVDNFVCLGLRSGIGAGLVIDGRLHNGPANVAGEIGGWPCEGSRSLEQLASVTAICETLIDAIGSGESSTLRVRRNRIVLDDLIQAAKSGDSLVCDVLWRAGQVLGKVVAQVNLLLNPRKVVIGGPLAHLDRQFVQSIREALEPWARPPHAMAPVVVGSKLGEFGAALGGAALAVHNWAATRPEN